MNAIFPEQPDGAAPAVFWKRYAQALEKAGVPEKRRFVPKGHSESSPAF